MKNTKNIVVTGMLIAIGLVLPPIIRMIPNGGVWFSPMHISPLLAGLAVGPVSGIITGIVCPLLNNLLYGMPMGPSLVGMCIELPVYGLVAGCMMKALKGADDKVRVYCSLITAMILGRIAGGLAQAFVIGAENYSIGVWATSYFVKTAPAIVIHLILLPAVYFALKKAGFVK